MVKGNCVHACPPRYADDLFPIGDKELTDDFEAWIGDQLDIIPPIGVRFFLDIRAKRNRYQQMGIPYLAIDQGSFISSVLARLVFFVLFFFVSGLLR